jgi:hypothetical protein
MKTGQKHDPGVKGGPILHEADIGSGERTPAQHETDQMIKEIPPLPHGGQGSSQQKGQPPNQQSGQRDTSGTR